MPEHISRVPARLDLLQARVVPFVIQRGPGHARGIQGRVREVGIRMIDERSVIGVAGDRHAAGIDEQVTLELIGLMRREQVKVVIVEPYFDLKTPNSIGSATGAKVLVLLPSVGGEKEVTNYFKLFDYDIALLTKAFKGAQ